MSAEEEVVAVEEVEEEVEEVEEEVSLSLLDALKEVRTHSYLSYNIHLMCNLHSKC